MSTSPLLALAVGALKGANDNRDARRQRQQEDLETELKLRSMPGVTLENGGNDQVRSALDTAGALVGQLGAGVGPTMTPATPAPPPGQQAGHIALGGRDLSVRYDPTQSPAGRLQAQDQANRASHERLQKTDPTLWNQQYDPNYDYGGAERDESKKAGTEKQLIAAGWDPTRAKLFARTGFDPDKRDAELEAKADGKVRLKLEERRTAAAEQSAAASAANATETRTDRRAKAAEGDAVNTATAWALEGKRQKISDGVLQQQIADALPAMYPDLTAAQRAGVAAQALLKRDEATARMGAQNRSGTKTSGFKLPGGVVLPPAGGAAPIKSTAAAPDKAKARQQAIEDGVAKGLTKEQIKADLKARGLT